MDPDPLAASTKNSQPRKVRFAPKAPPKREQKPVLPKPEKVENDIDGAEAEQLLRRLNETAFKGKPKAERKAAPAQVAFGFGRSTRSKNMYMNKGSSSNGGADQVVEKEYKEPWDYYTYYPVTLPLRRPYSGNPEFLDKEEFEGQSPYDESMTNPAFELGLLDENEENNLFFVQLPTTLPTIKQPTNAEGQELDKKDAKTSQKPSNLDSVPAGLLGKMLIYRSGAVKLKLGDTLYDVSPGLNSVFAQDVVAINTQDKRCCNVGELTKRAIITPDVESMLDSMSDL